MSVVSISETDEDLAGRWSLVFEDFALLNAKPAATRLGFAAQLLLYRTTGRFGRGAGIEHLIEDDAVDLQQRVVLGDDFLGRHVEHRLHHVHLDADALDAREEERKSTR